jgi:glyoxylase-like metal-dependent hydrolase (beta-lactamase superfamily II)
MNFNLIGMTSDDNAQRTGRLNRPARLRTIQFGDMRVSYLPDGVVQLNPRGWLPTTTEADWAQRREYLDGAGYLVASIGALLVEQGERAMLIDAGFGPQESPASPDSPLIGTIRGGALLDSLAELGRSPSEIETIAVTHLHTDHIGWALRGAFANARFLVAEPEWTNRDRAHPTVTGDMLSALEPSVRTVSDGEEIFPDVHVLAAAGHTPGHTAFTITSGDSRLIAFGDALHSPVQIGHPDWLVAVDTDQQRAVRARHELLAELRSPGTVGFGMHFADVVFGRVRREGDRHRWLSLDGAQD